MKVRDATAADRERLRELFTEFVHEIPPPSDLPLDLEHELDELNAYMGSQAVALVAEDDAGEIVGFALGKLDRHPGVGTLNDLYVAPGARRQGAARELIRRVTEVLGKDGAKVITLGVQIDNTNARTTYERLGFRVESVRMFAPVEHLLERAGRQPEGESFGSVHVQTDDRHAVEQGVRKYIPRFGRSGGSVVTEQRNGWITVYDELCDREPETLHRLGAELSNATGAVTLAIGIEEGAVVRYLLYERGSMVDEYLSVPEYYKPLPPGDTIALGANPTVVARLTGADANAIRRVARTAAAPEELDPPLTLLGRIAELMGVSGVSHGYEGAAEEPGAQAISHG